MTEQEVSRGGAETRSSNYFVMAGLDPATQQGRVRGRKDFLLRAQRALLGGVPTLPLGTKGGHDELRGLRASAPPRETPSSSAEAGYTLMELLVVLAILGLLAAIATPMVLHYLGTAKFGTAKTEIANYSAGLDLFKYDVGRYPTTQEGLQSLVKAPPAAENWNGPYVKVTNNLNDPWGHPFIYRSPGEHGEFDLFSYGPDGKEGAGDVKPAISNW